MFQSFAIQKHTQVSNNLIYIYIYIDIYIYIYFSFQLIEYSVVQFYGISTFPDNLMPRYSKFYNHFVAVAIRNMCNIYKPFHL